MSDTEIYIAPGDGLAARALGGEMVVMVAASARLLTLNETASRLFQAADGLTPLRRIVAERICADFEVGFEQAYADAVQCAEGLAAAGVLRLGPDPLPPPEPVA